MPPLRSGGNREEAGTVAGQEQVVVWKANVGVETTETGGERLARPRSNCALVSLP